jgi:hypothetical protein
VGGYFRGPLRIYLFIFVFFFLEKGENKRNYWWFTNGCRPKFLTIPPTYYFQWQNDHHFPPPKRIHRPPFRYYIPSPILVVRSQMEKKISKKDRTHLFSSPFYIFPFPLAAFRFGCVQEDGNHLPCHAPSATHTGATTACHNGWHIVRAITITETES